MQEPLLSVCLITYNHVKYIREAIDGVLMQKVNFTWELIIADDFSTDGTRELVLEYKKKFPEFIKLIFQESNVGAALNWIDLITYPKSKYIAYCEGDDYWTDPYKLQKQVDFMESNVDYVICFHKVKILYDSNLREDFLTKVPARTTTTVDLLNGNYIHTCSLTFRKPFGLFPPSYFDKLPIGDYPLILYLSKFGKIFCLDDLMAVYRVHKGGVWSEKNYWTYRDFRRREILTARTIFTISFHHKLCFAIILIYKSFRIYISSTLKYFFNTIKYSIK